MLQGKCGCPFLCLPQKIACSPSCPSSAASERWHDCRCDAGPLAWQAGRGHGAGASIAFLSFSTALLAIRMLASFSQRDRREVTKGHVWPLAVVQGWRWRGAEVHMRTAGCAEGTVQCSYGCSHGNKTLGSPLGCAHSQVELWLGLGQYELCQEPF